MKQWFLVLMIAVSVRRCRGRCRREGRFSDPTTYEVKERYGVNNAYTGSFKAGEGIYVVRLQLGDQAPERPEFLELTMNGEKVLRDDTLRFRIYRLHPAAAEGEHVPDRC